MLILLLEDEPIIAQFIGEAMEESGCSVLYASNTAEVMRLCEQFRPAFALLNFRTNAGANGTALAREIRKRFHTRILFITGARKQDIENSPPSESDYPALFKPFTRQQFRRAFTTMMAGLQDAG